MFNNRINSIAKLGVNRIYSNLCTRNQQRSVTGVKKVVAVFAVTFNSIIIGKYSNFLFITKKYEIKSTISWLL